jgi:hypothetical protein
MASVQVKTNGQTLTVNASISHWTTAALAVTASAANDVESTTTTPITSDYTMHFSNTATTAVITVKQSDGTILQQQTLDVSAGTGPRVLNPLPDPYQVATDLGAALALPLAPTGALAETFSRKGGTFANGAILATAREHCIAISLPAGMTVTNVTFISAVTAADTPVNWWFTLRTAGRVLMAQTADQTTTAWAANTIKTVALTAPQTTTYSGLHYLGIMVKATAVPTLMSVTSLAAAVTHAPILNGYADASLTDTAAATAAVLTPQSGMPYAYVS